MLEKSVENVDLTNLNVIEKAKSDFFHVYYDNEYVDHFDKRQFTKDEIRECLSGLLKDGIFQTMLRDTIGRRKEAYEGCNNFRDELGKFINTQHPEEKLEGKCDECVIFLFWDRYKNLSPWKQKVASIFDCYVF